MSAPESNSKVPPSLLSEPAKDGQAGGSRILANLEGRVDPSANSKPRRSRTLPVLIAALLIVAGGVGAYQLAQRPGGAESQKVASAAVQKEAAQSASTVVASRIRIASGATASTETNAAASSSSAPATIVADNDASKDTSAPNDDSNRLSRALSDGAGQAETSASADTKSAKSDEGGKPANAANAVNSKPAEKAAHSKHDRRQLAEERHAKESKTAVASHAKKQNGKQATKDDSDADLLAALVARTKPASAKTDKAVDADVASKKVSAAGNPSATLAERINECGQHGFFEEQLCRWRVCDGHWGKDPHCPAASAQARQP
jgi:hypothetical protein